MGSAAVDVEGTMYIYLLKGSNTFEYYRYNTSTKVWETLTNAQGGASGKAFKKFFDRQVVHGVPPSLANLQ